MGVKSWKEKGGIKVLEFDPVTWKPVQREDGEGLEVVDVSSDPNEEGGQDESRYERKWGVSRVIFWLISRWS